LAELERAWFQSRPYDLVMLDQMMPGLAGTELARRIRAAPFVADTKLSGVVLRLTCRMARPAWRWTRNLKSRSGGVSCWTQLGKLFGTADPVPAMERPARRGRGSAGRGDAGEPQAAGIAGRGQSHQPAGRLAAAGPCGHQVTVAQNGFEAVDAVRHERFTWC